MGAGSLGDLLITMSADTAKWQSDMGKMVKETQARTMEMSSAFEGVSAAIGKASGLLVALAAGAGLKELVSSSVEWNTEVVKLSKTLGQTTEEASGFKSMLEHLGIDQDTLTNSMLKLEKAAASSPEKFDKLGISIRDANGNLLPAQQILMNFNDRMKDFEEGAPRNAAASMVMGKGTRDLGSLLKATNAELEAGAERVKNLGLVVTEEGAAKTLAYRQSMNDLGEALGAVKKAIGNELIGELTKLSTSMSQGIEHGFPAFVSGLRQTEGELVRLAMLTDKAGGSLTRLGHDALMVAAAVAGGDLTPQGRGMHQSAAWFEEQNKLYEQRYRENEKSIQRLANLDAGYDENGQEIKPAKEKKAGKGFNPNDMTDKASDWTAAHNKYIEYEKAFEERRAGLVKNAATLELEINQQAYDMGLTDLRSYLETKHALNEEAMYAEVEAKRKELADAQGALGQLKPVTDAKGKGNPSKDDENYYAALAKVQLAKKALNDAENKLKVDRSKNGAEMDKQTTDAVRGWKEQQAALADFQGDFVRAAAIRAGLDNDSDARQKLIANAMAGDKDAIAAYWAAEAADIEKVRQAALAQKKVLDDIRLSTPDKYGNVDVYGQKQQQLNAAIGGIDAQKGSNPETAQLKNLEDQKTAILAKSKAEQLATQQKYDADMLQSQMSAADNAMSLMVKASGDSKAMQIAALAVHTGIAIAQIEISTAVAAAKALEELGPIAGPPVAAEMWVMGYANMALVAASGMVQAVSIAGKREGGGPVAGGATYLVGEKGPELFTPAASGNITPNHALGGGDVTIHQNFQVTGVGADIEQNTRVVAKRAADQAKAEIMDSMNRGGKFALASGRLGR